MLSSEHENIIGNLNRILNGNPIDEIGYINSLNLEYRDFILQSNNSKLGIPIHLCREIAIPLRNLLLMRFDEFIESNKFNELDKLTKALCIFQPNFYPIYRMRKQLLLLKNDISFYIYEIHLLNLMFYLLDTVKLSYSWHHRKWLVEHISKNLETYELNKLILKEFEFIERVLARTTRNYYIFNYEYFLLDKIIFKTQNSKTFLDQRLDFMLSYVHKNPYESGAIYHLSNILSTYHKITPSQDNFINIIKSVYSLIERYPNIIGLKYGLLNIIYLCFKKGIKEDLLKEFEFELNKQLNRMNK